MWDSIGEGRSLRRVRSLVQSLAAPRTGPEGRICIDYRDISEG